MGSFEERTIFDVFVYVYIYIYIYTYVYIYICLSNLNFILRTKFRIAVGMYIIRFCDFACDLDYLLFIYVQDLFGIADRMCISKACA